MYTGMYRRRELSIHTPSNRIEKARSSSVPPSKCQPCQAGCVVILGSAGKVRAAKVLGAASRAVAGARR